ncbi:MAG: hypothetical protein R3F39_01835 [Myxococcota bacterium]
MKRAMDGLVRVALLAAMAGAGAGCANATDSELNKLPSSTKVDVVTDTKPDTGPAGSCDCASVGDWYRFTTLAIDTLAGEENILQPILNGLWAGDIAAYSLNILVEVTEVTETEVRLRAVSGARVGEPGSSEVCVLPGTEFEVIHPRSGCELQASQPTGINVFAGSTSKIKNCAPGLSPIHAIPARDLVLEATVSNDCSMITGGKVLSGVLTESALGSVCSCLKPKLEDCSTIDPGYVAKNGSCGGCNTDFSDLKGLLKLQGGIETFDCQSASGEPAICLSAHFEAARMDSSPMPCPQ